MPLIACLLTNCIHNQGKFPHACNCPDAFVNIKPSQIRDVTGVPVCDNFKEKGAK